MHTIPQMTNDLKALGVCRGDTLMMHSSYKSLGGIEGGAAGVFEALFAALGEEGTLILPAFSYMSVTADSPIFDRASTPSCVGYLPEYFRTEVAGVVRSMHATHSCSVKGARAVELIAGHEEDLTPVGRHSSIAKLPRVGGKILILGSHPNSNTSLHGVEEWVEPEYLYDDTEITYTLKDGAREIQQTARRHGFEKNGFFYEQQYSRVIDLLEDTECTHGWVLDAECYLLSAEAVWREAEKALKRDPLYFVNKRKEGAE